MEKKEYLYLNYLKNYSGSASYIYFHNVSGNIYDLSQSLNLFKKHGLKVRLVRNKLMAKAFSLKKHRNLNYLLSSKTYMIEFTSQEDLAKIFLLVSKESSIILLGGYLNNTIYSASKIIQSNKTDTNYYMELFFILKMVVLLYSIQLPMKQIQFFLRNNYAYNQSAN